MQELKHNLNQNNITNELFLTKLNQMFEDYESKDNSIFKRFKPSLTTADSIFIYFLTVENNYRTTIKRNNENWKVYTITLKQISDTLHKEISSIYRTIKKLSRTHPISLDRSIITYYKKI